MKDDYKQKEHGNDDYKNMSPAPAGEWEAEHDAFIKSQPDSIRLLLANYAAKQFLDGIQEGESRHRALLVEKVERLEFKSRNEYANEMVEDFRGEILALLKE